MTENENWIALHIPEFVLGIKYFTRVRRFERSFYNGTVIDGARFLKKSTFVEVGGFDETMSGPEDWDIDKKIKQIGNIGLLPSSSAYFEDDSWKYKNYIIERGVDPNGKWNCIFHNETEFNLLEYLSKKNTTLKVLITTLKNGGETILISANKWASGIAFLGYFWKGVNGNNSY